MKTFFYGLFSLCFYAIPPSSCPGSRHVYCLWQRHHHPGSAALLAGVLATLRRTVQVFGWTSETVLRRGTVGGAADTNAALLRVRNSGDLSRLRTKGGASLHVCCMERLRIFPFTGFLLGRDFGCDQR
jgi:hypothetical protein